MEAFIWLLSGMTDAYAFEDLFSCEFEEKLEKKRWMYLYLGAVVVLSTVIAVLASEKSRLLFSLVVYFAAANFFFIGSRKMKCVFLIIYFFMMIFSEIMGVLAYGEMTGNYLVNAMGDYGLGWVILCLKVMLYKILVTKLWVYMCGKRSHLLYGNTAFLILVIPIVSCILGFIFIKLFFCVPEEMQIYLVISVFLLLLVNVVVFYPFEKMSELLNEQREMELFQLKNQLEESYYNRIEEIARKQQVYQHDMKQYMSAIATLLAKEQSQEAEKLFQQMQIQVKELEQKAYSGNGILNALLSEKENQAKRQGVELLLEIEPAVPLSFLKDTDMIAMFGNLIDNALRAAAQCQQGRKVSVRLFEPEGNFIFFVVENPYAGELSRAGARFLSTKEEGGEHGIGLMSVRGLAKKYGGILDLQQEDGFFIATLSLSKGFYREK